MQPRGIVEAVVGDHMVILRPRIGRPHLRVGEERVRAGRRLDIENGPGRQVRPATLRRLAKTLGVEPEHLSKGA